MRIKQVTVISCLLVAIFACRKDEPIPVASTTPYVFDLPKPLGNYGDMVIPEDNPMTVEGVALGKKLFYDKRLSNDENLSCNSCHLQEYSFSTPSNAIGDVDGGKVRNVMPLVNLGWVNAYAWDGRKTSLEEKIKESFLNPYSLNAQAETVLPRLAEDDFYPTEFEVVFGDSEITFDRIAKALAQFFRTLVSGNSPYDKYLRNGVGGSGWSQENELKAIQGYAIFEGEIGDCAHCHGNEFNPLWTDGQMRNNGLDASFEGDLGYGFVTGNASDNGKFRSPSLRNLAFTAPYMHDGRFETLDEVIDHYSFGLVHSPTIDPLMKKVDDGGVALNPTEKECLKLFLLSLSDSSFITNPEFME